MSLASDIIEVIELSADGWSLGVAPSSGAIVWADFEQCEILRRTNLRRGWERDPFSVSHFPLAPYSNRIRNGEFEFDGKTFRIKPNAPGQAHPLHGVAWLGNWSQSASSKKALLLDYVHRPNEGWPWAFSLSQAIVIDGAGLSIRLTLRNTSTSPMPAGLGFHPYFADPNMARLAFSANGAWLPDRDNLPEEWRPLDMAQGFSAGRALDDVEIDQCFTGWREQARIDWRDRPFGVDVTADPALAFAVVYVSQKERCFCFEPVSQMNDALNWTKRRDDTGLRVLQPGEEWTATTKLHVRETLTTK